MMQLQAAGHNDIHMDFYYIICPDWLSLHATVGHAAQLNFTLSGHWLIIGYATQISRIDQEL